MRLSSFVILLLCSFFSIAQQTPSKQGDYLFPIRPDQENYLSGTMGELRRTHFHAGIDIKTSGITGLPVYATADGYIQRIRVSLGGYGNALYVAHPELGTVSVYAHLKSFDPAIAAFVRSKQYENESFEVNLFPAKNQFKFLQGDIIAYSGNSGSSSGPHLHFEIRTGDHRVLDPLKYGFKEIKDEIAPTLQKVAFVTKNINARVNGEFGRHEYKVIKNEKGEWALDAPVFVQGLIGVEIYAYDKFDGANNRNGILNQSLSLDSQKVFSQDVDSLMFSMGKSIYVHTNYKRSSEGGSRFNKLYVDDGNQLHFYQTDAAKGLININDPLPHDMEIRLSDSYGNISQFVFRINNDLDPKESQKVSYVLNKKGFDIHENVLEFQVDLSDHGYCEGQLYIDGRVEMCQLAYDMGDMGYYLWDLRRGLPDSIVVCDKKYITHFSKMISPNTRTYWQGDRVTIDFPPKCLFDTAVVRYEYKIKEGQEVFGFENHSTPFRRNFSVKLFPQKSYDRSKSSVYKLDKIGNLGYVGGQWESDYITIKSRELINYTVATDSLPPTIQRRKSTPGSLKFKLQDQLSGISEIRADLDGKWLLMHFDAKSGIAWTDPKATLEGNFTLSVKDNVNNGTVFELNIPTE